MTATTILSPHPDDAVLSLWRTLAGPGEVRVVNLFAGAPNGSREPGWWDRLTGADDAAERAGERRREDEEALGLVGRVPVHLDFLDLQYRDGDDSTASLVDGVAATVPHGGLLLVPAALDGHPDHRQAREVGLELGRRGGDVSLYADLPHAAFYGWPPSVTGASQDPYLDPGAAWDRYMEGTGLSLRNLEAQVSALSAGEQAAKLEAVKRYRTQLSGLEQVFGILSRREVLGYEVIWPLPTSALRRKAHGRR